MKDRIIILLALVLAACSGHKGEIRLLGEFQNMDQGDFFIYSTDGGLTRVDTIHIIDGEFDYRTALKDSATFQILYPNYSTLPIFGKSGDVIEIKGDVQNLNAVSVTGSEDNEAYTRYRMEMTGKSSIQQDSIKQAFLQQNPTSAAARWIVMQDEADAVPRPIRVGEQIPTFEVRTRQGRTITPQDFRNHYLLIAFWANWRGSSTNAISEISKIRRSGILPMEYISCSLDVDTTMVSLAERRDSVTWHSVCDQKSWRGNMPTVCGLRDIPYYILVNPAGKILFSGKTPPTTDFLKKCKN